MLTVFDMKVILSHAVMNKIYKIYNDKMYTNNHIFQLIISVFNIFVTDRQTDINTIA